MWNSFLGKYNGERSTYTNHGTIVRPKELPVVDKIPE